jgi:hypothetical protein
MIFRVRERLSGGNKPKGMLHKFANSLSVLLDYYGNFECDRRIVLFIQQAESDGSCAGSKSTDDDLEGIAADGSPLSSAFSKDPVNRESHGPK